MKHPYHSITRREFAWQMAVVFFCMAQSMPTANAQGIRADYERAAQLPMLTRRVIVWRASPTGFFRATSVGSRTTPLDFFDSGRGCR